MAYEIRPLARMTLGCLCAAALACGDSQDTGAGGSPGFDTRVLDLREFQRFEIDQTPGFGPGCPKPYLVDPATIERLDDTTYLLSFSVAFSSEEEFNDCAFERPNRAYSCTFEAPIPHAPRRLSRSDLSELMALLADVPVNFNPDPCGGADQCSVLRLTWDELSTDDRYCEGRLPRISENLSRTILESVTDLTHLPQ